MSETISTVSRLSLQRPAISNAQLDVEAFLSDATNEAESLAIRSSFTSELKFFNIFQYLLLEPLPHTKVASIDLLNIKLSEQTILLTLRKGIYIFSIIKRIKLEFDGLKGTINLWNVDQF